MVDNENIEQVAQKKKKKRLIIILLLLLLFLAGAGGAYWYYMTHQPEEKKVSVVSGDFLPDSKDASEMSDGEIASYAQKAVDDSQFQMIIGSEITVNSQTKASNIYIQNPPNNGYPIDVTITLEDGTVVYSSGAINVGYEVKNATFDTTMNTGTYTGTALFKLYDPETSKAKGQVAAKVTITVT